MVSSKLSMKLFLLDKYSSLDEVEKNILNKIYKEPLKISKTDIHKSSALSEDDRVFNYSWKKKDLIKDKIVVSTNNKEEKFVECLEIFATLENPKKRKKDFNGMILPKKERVRDTDIKVIFFKFENNIYFIIFCSNEIYTDRVKKLIGSNIIKNPGSQYELSADLFNWLFYKFSLNQGKLSVDLIIQNISGFIGNTVDEHNVFKSSSDQTSDLIVTKAFISNGEILRNVTTKIKSKEADIVFSIDNMSNAILYLNQSMLFFNSSSNERAIPIYLYTELIPKIKIIYKNNAEKFLSTEKKSFSAKIGLEVIKSIIDNNALDIEEIEMLFGLPKEFSDTILK